MTLRFNFGYLHIAMVWEEGLRPPGNYLNFYTYLDNTTEYLGIHPVKHSNKKLAVPFISADQISKLINIIKTTRKQL